MSVEEYEELESNLDSALGETNEILHDDDDIEVEIVEEDRSSIPDDDDLSREIRDTSRSADSRIKQLTKQFRTAERERDEARATTEEAIDYAKRAHQRTEQLESIVQRGEGVLVSVEKERVKESNDRAKSELKQALDAGDTDLIADAQERIARAQAESVAIERRAPILPPQQQQQQAQRQNQDPAQQNQSRAPELHPRTAQWLNANPWYRTSSEDGSNEVMQAEANRIDKTLQREGVENGSEEYWEAIDQGMKDRFPERFGAARASRNGRQNGAGQPAERQSAMTVVAPVTRSSGPRRKVRLSPSQVQLAEGLGISPKDYARSLAEGEEGRSRR